MVQIQKFGSGATNVFGKIGNKADQAYKGVEKFEERVQKSL